MWSQQLELYLGIHEQKLRFFTAVGLLVATPMEVAQQQTQKVETLTAKLRELGVDLDTI